MNNRTAMTFSVAPFSNVGRLALLISGLCFWFSNSLDGFASTPENAIYSGPVRVEIYENLDREDPFDLSHAKRTGVYSERAFGFVTFPTKYSGNALPLDRSTPFAIRATYSRGLPEGPYQFRLRSKGLAKFRVNDAVLLETEAQKPNASSHDELPPPIERDSSLPELHRLMPPHREARGEHNADGNVTQFTLIAIIGGKGLAPFPGELSVSFGRPGKLPQLLGEEDAPALTDENWNAYKVRQLAKHRAADIEVRRHASAKVVGAWEAYHGKVRRWIENRPSVSIPETSGDSVLNVIDRFINARLSLAGRKPNGLLSDRAFLRRLSLDTIGLVPTPADIQEFLNDPPETRRERAVERFLEHPGWADHWVGYWQDVLAENPGILKPDLNNSGPFRWWLHQSFYDNIPFDRLAAELLQMRGSVYFGGPAGFGVAKLNDAPMAAKADVLAQAFLGEKLSCARCHDAPDHPHKQADTFQLAAMLSGGSIKLPKTSTVPFVEGFRKPRVEVSLNPGQEIHPVWPFEEFARSDAIAKHMPLQEDVPETRNEAVRRIVSPANERFARVIVNRVWKRYVGAGFVEPAEDWQWHAPSHPELLDWLAREFIRGGYNLKALARLIFNSHTYQRRPVSRDWTEVNPEDRLFAGPARRRLTAEQLVDSLHQCVGKRFESEELNLNPLGDRPLSQFLNMGRPTRAWEFTALMNERDRPSLALPAAQSIVDVLTAFGWRQSRMNPVTDRNDDPSPMQALALANGVMGTRIVRLSDNARFTELALEHRALESLVVEAFQWILSRPPTESEMTTVRRFLEPFHENRRVEDARAASVKRFRSDLRVSWANHFDEESNRIRMEEERTLRMGEPPTRLLTTAFRERFEDFLWSLVNSPEFVLVP